MVERRNMQVSRKGAIKWCTLFGFAGGHRFYLGQYWLGCLYLSFFWTGIPLVAAAIDLVALVSQDDDDFLEELREDPSYCHRSLVLQRSAVSTLQAIQHEKKFHSDSKAC